MVKISAFGGIRPPSLDSLEVLQNLESNFVPGEKVRVYFKGGKGRSRSKNKNKKSGNKNTKYFLYPPEQLYDKGLKICRATNINRNTLRVQV